MKHCNLNMFGENNVSPVMIRAGCTPSFGSVTTGIGSDPQNTSVSLLIGPPASFLSLRPPLLQVHFGDLTHP